MLRRVEIGVAPGTVLVAPMPLAGGIDGRRDQQQQQQPREQQQRWAGAHAWRAMTLTPGEVEIYSSFMNNAPPEARRRLFAAGDRLSARGGCAADGRQRLQKYVTQQNQRHFLAANQPSASSLPLPPTRSSAASSPFVAVQASRALGGRRSLSWSGLSADSQFRATRAIRKMLFSARRRAAGCGGCVVPADSLDLSAAASGHTPAPVVAVLKTHRGGDGDGRPTSPSRFVLPSRRLGDVRALTGRQAPVVAGGFRRRLAGRWGGGGDGLESASINTSAAGASTLPAASAQLRSNGVRDRTAAAVAAVAAATTAESRKAAAARASGRADPRFDTRRPQAPAAASVAVAVETLFQSNAAATGNAAGSGHTPSKAAGVAVAASRDEPSPPSNTPDDLSGDLDSMSLLSGGAGGAGEFAIETACLTGSSGLRRIEVYMPALAT